MKILVLGGTRFLGRHIVEAALAGGHDITLFNRGQNNPDLFPEVEKLRGNRDGDLSALQGRQWDAVIDTCGFVPRIVQASAALLADSVRHYTFISSISVYADFSKPAMNENAPVGTMQDESIEEITAETYGPLKALCERTAEKAMPGRVLHIRPGYIVGPFDPTDRFTYWPRRVATGGEMLAPGRPDSQIQFVDVRDLANWIIRMVETGKAHGQQEAATTEHAPKPKTPTFLLELPLVVQAGQAARVGAHLEVGRQFYNAVLSAACAACEPIQHGRQPLPSLAPRSRSAKPPFLSCGSATALASTPFTSWHASCASAG